MRRLSQLTLLILLLSLPACSAVFESPPPTPTMIQPTATATLTPVPSPTPTPETVGGAITIWHAWPDSELPALVQVINGFRGQYPQALFDVLYVPMEDLPARFAAEAREGRGPDILLGRSEWGPGLYDAGLIADLSDVIPAERLNDLNPAAVESARWRGALIAAPYAMSGVVLYRNKEIITLPADSLDDLIMLAQTATQGEVIGAILEQSFYYSGGHLYGQGGALMNDEGQPAFNDPNGLKWIDVVLRFNEAGPTSFFTDADLERFEAGKAGWIIEGTWNLRRLASALGPERLAIDPWPSAGSGSLSGFVMADPLYVNANALSGSRLTLGTFVNYFLSVEAQTYLAEAGRIPVTAGVVLSDPATGPLITEAVTALAGGVAYPIHPGITVYNIQLDAALRSIIEQNIPPAQALDSAAEAIQTELAASPTQLP